MRGRVQGVGFRVFVLREASCLGLAGFVANERDGGVRVMAEGPHRGPRGAARAPPRGPARGVRGAGDRALGAARGIGGGFRIESGEHRGD